MILTIVFLILLGLLLLFAELFVVPGMTVVGIAGMLFLGAGVWFTYDAYGFLAGNIALFLTVGLSAVVLIRSFRSRFWEKFQLKEAIESKANDEDARDENPVLVEEIGLALSALRPTGTARFGKRIREVECISGFAAAGQSIRVVRRDGNRIYVKTN
jgi:membrane-bound ClpP family serine protease